MQMPRLVVSGLPRSGTTYLTNVLRGLGIEASHEGVFRFRSYWDRVEIRPNGAAAEISWIAAPFLSILPPETYIGILLRKPVEVLNSIASQVGRAPWAGREGYLDVGQWVETILGDPPVEPRDKAVYLYLGWHGLLRNAIAGSLHRTVVIRLENLEAEKLALVCGWTGLAHPPIELAREALESTPKDTNTRGPVQRWFDEAPNEVDELYREFAP